MSKDVYTLYLKSVMNELTKARSAVDRAEKTLDEKRVVLESAEEKMAAATEIYSKRGQVPEEFLEKLAAAEEADEAEDADAPFAQ